MDNKRYVGQELAVFANAVTWKRYVASMIVEHIGRRVVEVGAGLGANTAILCDGSQSEWLCLEPDPLLRTEIDRRIASGQLPSCCRTCGASVADLPLHEAMDSFIYIDVLEHIKNDRLELETAAGRLTPGGSLIVVSPAFQFLFSAFDEAIGHYRRYNKRSLSLLTPPGCRLQIIRYLDSLGAATSLANRFLLRQRTPTEKQISFWDRRVVRVSQTVDPIVRYRVGRSIVAVWRK